MSVQLTPLQKRLCNILQDGLSVCPKPFAEIAKVLGESEETILRQIRELKERGFIRRLRPMINYRALGRVSELITAHIPKEDVQEVAEAVNKLDGVSHNYLREHHYNLWFTLQGSSQAEIDTILLKLSSQFGIDFHGLPVTRSFKLDVRFAVENGDNSADVAETANKLPKTKTVRLLRLHSGQVRSPQEVSLSDKQKLVLSKLQNELEIIERPFDFLCEKRLKEKEVFEIINSLIDKGVITRVGAVLDQCKLGLIANVMFTCVVPQERVIEAGNALARFGLVSHCYERKTFEGWPYNLFAMMHGLSMGDIQKAIDEFTEAERIEDFEMLPTIAEFKKRPVEYQL